MSAVIDPQNMQFFIRMSNRRDNDTPKVPHDGHGGGTLRSPHGAARMSPLGYFKKYPR